MLPSMNGYTIIEKLRLQKIDYPMLILSAKSSLDDKIKGLTIGADDYLPKPFALSELKARVEALIRRSTRSSAGTELKVADLKLDLSDQRVFRGDQEIELQPKEFLLLKYLVENQDQVVSKKMIIEKVWHYNFDPNTNIVEVRMCKLRDKIDKNFNNKLISTVRGVGYVLKG
ncbi:UNVERIFIED_CONTAM: hypothetical protein GTU68_034133 [Idotea baltica]|nr:hypothetical protein [Idotea baltica]